MCEKKLPIEAKNPCGCALPVAGVPLAGAPAGIDWSITVDAVTEVPLTIP